MSEISSHVRFFPAGGGGGGGAPYKLVNRIGEGKGKGKRNERSPGVIWVNFCWICAAGLSEPLPHSIKKMHFYLRVNVFSTKVLNGDTIFLRLLLEFTWSTEPREGQACCSAKEVPSFLGYFKTLSIDPAPGNPRPPALQSLYRLS